MKRIILLALLCAGCGTKNRPEAHNIRERVLKGEPIICNCWNIEECRSLYDEPTASIKTHPPSLRLHLQAKQHWSKVMSELEEQCSLPALAPKLALVRSQR